MPYHRRRNITWSGGGGPPYCGPKGRNLHWHLLLFLDNSFIFYRKVGEGAGPLPKRGPPLFVHLGVLPKSKVSQHVLFDIVLYINTLIYLNHWEIWCFINWSHVLPKSLVYGHPALIYLNHWEIECFINWSLVLPKCLVYGGPALIYLNHWEIEGLTTQVMFYLNVWCMVAQLWFT